MFCFLARAFSLSLSVAHIPSLALPLGLLPSPDTNFPNPHRLTRFPHPPRARGRSRRSSARHAAASCVRSSVWRRASPRPAQATN
eukprot:1777135-Pleurochrysis_carterae.AAC.1